MADQEELSVVRDHTESPSQTRVPGEWVDNTEEDEELDGDESQEMNVEEEAYFRQLIADDSDEDPEEKAEEEEDAEDLANIEIEIPDTDGDDVTIAAQRAHIMSLLRNSNIADLLLGDINGRFRSRRRREPLDPNRFPKIPSDEGTELMNSGQFGSSEAEKLREGEMIIGKKLARRILDREIAIESTAKRELNQRLMAQGMVPSSNADMIIHYNQPVYSGQFSNDGNFFFSVNKDFRVRMYDTSNPYKWRYYKTVDYPFGQWTLTDATLSPDNRYLAYTSITPEVCLAPTDPNDKGDPYVLDLAGGQAARHANQGWRSRSFGIWSVKFSGDGRRLVAGATEGKIVVYDIESRSVLHSFDGHDSDTNAVCFADQSSPHIVYSGSDDRVIKVWDTRSMGGDREVGAFMGHIEGLTYIDSKGDGRYILSNGKDQSMKLWDLRMVMSRHEFRKMTPDVRNGNSNFDYRWSAWDDDEWYKDRNDNSLVTFRGHKVLRTLIRCHFSPPGSTNSRYVYSGSEDGKVYIWNMDATPAGVIDVQSATRNSRPRYQGFHQPGRWHQDVDDEDSSAWKTCVRDASWHPNAPVIVASAWNGYAMSTGTCTVHSWNDGAEKDEADPKMGYRVNQKLEVDPALYGATPDMGPGRMSARVRNSRLFVP